MKQTKIILVFTAILFISYSCKEKNFSKKESEYIMSGNKNEILRLFTIDNKTDSILLRNVSTDIIPDSNDVILQHLISRMYATVNDTLNPGVGIAAPQIGINKRIIWVQRFDKVNEPFEVYLNPYINHYSKLKRGGAEGCLSIPDIRGNVCRSYAITIDYDMIDGKHYSELIEGFTAVIFQHEIDHLNGKLFIDYTSNNTDTLSKEDFQIYCEQNSKVQ